MNKDEPKTLSIPVAGKTYLNLGKNGSYAAAKRGEIPTIKVGSRFRVPVVAMDRMLDLGVEKCGVSSATIPAFAA
jgi:hypothetical protein